MKRVLFVAHCFYEDNMGAVRLRRLARALPAAGYPPVVLAHPPHGHSDDLLPASIQVHYANGVDLTLAYRKLSGILRPDGAERAGASPGGSRDIGFTTWVNRWCMIPDKHLLWARPAEREGRRAAEHHGVDLIFASLDPRTNLLAAAKIADATGLPLVIEYRDLWTGTPYFHRDYATPLHGRLHGRLHRRLERRVLGRANRVTTVCRAIAEQLSSRYASVLRHPIALNHNSYDPAEYPRRRRRSDGRLVICYAGATYPGRDPEVFLEGLGRFVLSQRISPQQLRFVWLGQLSGISDPRKQLRELGIEPYVQLRGTVPHSEALQTLVDSDLALVIQAPQDRVHVPGKIFEAMGARVSILAISPRCETTELIAQTKSGLSCEHDPDAVAQLLGTVWRRLREGSPWTFDEPAIESFRIDHAADRMARLFDQAVEAHPSAMASRARVLRPGFGTGD